MAAGEEAVGSTKDRTSLNSDMWIDTQNNQTALQLTRTSLEARALLWVNERTNRRRTNDPAAFELLTCHDLAATHSRCTGKGSATRAVSNVRRMRNELGM